MEYYGNKVVVCRGWEMIIIRRSLFFAAISFCAAILICFFAGKAAAAVILAALFLFYLFKKSGKAAVLLTFYAVSFLNFALYDLRDSGTYEFIGKQAEAVGKVESCLEKKNSRGEKYIQLKISVSNLNGKPIDGGPFKGADRILISCYNRESAGEKFCPGYDVKAEGVLQAPRGRRNPGCFDYAFYLKTIGIDTLMNAESVEVLNSRNTLEGRLYNLKKSYEKTIGEKAGQDAAALMSGIMFGEKEDIDSQVLENFQKNGTAHILAVSGLHVGMVYGFLSLLWRWKKGRAFFVFVTIFMICYLILASFSPSVVRAVLMVELHGLAKVLNMRYDLSSAAFLAVMLILMKNPMMIFNAGFQMSFIAVFSMAAVIPFIKRVHDGVFTAGLAVQAGLLPYTMYTFNYLSLASFLVNIPIIFLTGIIVPLGLLALMGVFLSESVQGMFSWIEAFSQVFTEILAKFIAGICEMIVILNDSTCIDGITAFEAVSPGIVFLSLYYMGAVIFLSEEGRLAVIRRRRKTLLLLTSFAIAASLLLGLALNSGFERTGIVFVDVGQGDCVHIRSREGDNYLFDGGGSAGYNLGKDTLKPYLLKNGVRRIDGAFVTHLHTDHYKGVAELCREGMVKRIFVYEGNFLKEDRILKDTGLEREQIVYVSAGERISLCNDVSVDIISPRRKSENDYRRLLEDEEDENEMSLVMKVSAWDKSLLITGDIDRAMEDELCQRYGNTLKSDILKVAHHGSRYSYSDSFAERVAPEYAVFQVGENNYGHPDEGVIAKYEELGAEILRNDRDGAVGFIIEEGKRSMEVVTVLP